jgi:hypothetical protein
VRGLRRESGWGQAAEAKRMNYVSDADPRMYPVLDTGMVQAEVEVGLQSDILPLVAQARCPCYGQPFH